jgi:hypothetical protein
MCEQKASGSLREDHYLCMDAVYPQAYKLMAMFHALVLVYGVHGLRAGFRSSSKLQGDFIGGHIIQYFTVRQLFMLLGLFESSKLGCEKSGHQGRLKVVDKVNEPR